MRAGLSKAVHTITGPPQPYQTAFEKRYMYMNNTSLDERIIHQHLIDSRSIDSRTIQKNGKADFEKNLAHQAGREVGDAAAATAYQHPLQRHLPQTACCRKV